MKVSVVIPYYNRIDLLLETIGSVINSTMRPEELILVNDCSPELLAEKDLTWCEANFSNFVHLRNAQNSGPGFSRQRGLELAQGEFVHFLDSDDLVKPDFYEEVVAKIQTHPEAAMCYSFTNKYDGKNEIQGFKRKQVEVSNLIEAITTMNVSRVWSTSACVWRKSDALRSDGWPQTYWEDYYFDVAVGLINPKVVCVRKPLLLYRVHDQISVSQDLTYQKRLSKFETLLKMEKLVKNSNNEDLIFFVERAKKTVSVQLLNTNGDISSSERFLLLVRLDKKLALVSLFGPKLGEALINRLT